MFSTKKEQHQQPVAWVGTNNEYPESSNNDGLECQRAGDNDPAVHRSDTQSKTDLRHAQIQICSICPEKICSTQI
jgi:hypothetical protein